MKVTKSYSRGRRPTRPLARSAEVPQVGSSLALITTFAVERQERALLIVRSGLFPTWMNENAWDDLLNVSGYGMDPLPIPIFTQKEKENAAQRD